MQCKTYTMVKWLMEQYQYMAFTRKNNGRRITSYIQLQ